MIVDRIARESENRDLTDRGFLYAKAEASDGFAVVVQGVGHVVPDFRLDLDGLACILPTSCIH